MSKIYKLIEEQVNMLLEVVDKHKNITQWYSWPIIQIISRIFVLLLYIAVLLLVGVYLWNQGLVPVFPKLVSRIGANEPGQLESPYTQLIVTSFALMMIL